MAGPAQGSALGVAFSSPALDSPSVVNLTVSATAALPMATTINGVNFAQAAQSKTTFAAIPATATATASEVATGHINTTSAAATTITLPTGTLLGAALAADGGTVHKLYIDNTAGANTVTIAVAVNGILSAAAAAGAGAGAGLLTVPSGVTGFAEFTIMFSSPTAYTFSRTA
jgi:hypothetical protein